MSALLQGLTDQPNQQYPIALPDGSTATMILHYRPQQNGWYYDISWDGQSPPWQLLGMRLVAHPNLLRQYRNQITFGLAVCTSDSTDPTEQEDFVNGKCSMILLDAAEVLDIEGSFFPGD
jgi:hypothetical protein